MCRGFGKNGYCEARNSNGVKDDRRIVEIAKKMHTERVDNTMRGQYRGIYTHCLAGCWLVTCLNSGGCRNQIGATKGDASRDSKLASEIEPVMLVRTS